MIKPEPLNTYKVVIELEVTAENEAEAQENAAMDITELNRGGELYAEVTKLSDSE